MKKKYELTEEHRSQLKPWADKWIANAMSTKPMDDEDRSAMRIAIKGVYEAANLTPPPENRIVFVPSPFVAKFAGGFAAAIWWLRKNPKNKSLDDAATRDATDAATYDATRDATDAATCDATYDATRDATRDATDAAQKKSESFDKNSWFRFDVKAMSKISIDFNLGKFGLKCAASASRMYQGGNFWSGWVAYLSFFRHIAKLDIDYSKFDHWEKATIHGSYRIMHSEFCIISDRPKKLQVDNQNRPHCFQGPYCEWSDGSALYAIHGVRVPMWICETKVDEFTKEMILSENNVDFRRCIIQKIGINKAIELLGADVVDTYDSQVGGKYELLMVDYTNTGEKRPYLKMSNPSLENTYHIEGCHPNVKTCKEAIMFRNGLKKFIEPKVLS